MISVDLVPEWKVNDLSLTDYPYSVDRESEVEIGEPEVEIVTVSGGLADGDIEQESHTGNRTYVIPLYIEGPTMADLAENEAALRRELKKAGVLLSHNAGDGFAPTSVYEVFTARLVHARDDTHESHLIRRYTLTLRCSPWARSADLTTIEALEAAGTATTVDACNSATGWTGKVNGVNFGAADPAWLGSSGSVWAYDLFDPGPQLIELTRAGTFSITSPYLKIVTRGNEPAVTTATATVDGVVTELQLIAQYKTTADIDGYAFVFEISGTSVSSLTVANYSQATPSAFGVSDVAFIATPPSIAPRQITRVLHVGGTERTPASIHVASPDGTTDLGLVIVSTTPSRYPEVGFHPAMSRWYLSGTRTADASSVSGYRFRLDNGFMAAQAPAISFPEGGYQMAALMAASVEGTYEVVSLVQTRKAGTILKEWSNTEVVHLFPSPNWGLVDMGVPRLPILRAESGTDVVLAVKVRQTNGADLVGVTVEAQDAWMLPVDDGCGLEITLTDKANLWMDSPSTSSGVPVVLEGDNADRTGATFPLRGARSSAHVLSPGMTGITVITSISDYPAVSASYYKRWHSNAAE